MNVEILQENLSSAIATVSRFVPSRASLDILNHIYIEAQDTHLVLNASNMETAISFRLPAKISMKGKLTIPAKLLYEYINVLSPGKIELKAEANSLEIIKETYTAQISGSDAENFPVLPEFAVDQEINFKTKDIDRIIAKVSFAASNEEARPILAAILFNFDNQPQIEVVATDGYRLSRISDIKMTETIDATQLLIPARVLTEVEKLAKDKKVETVSLQLSHQQKSLRFVIADIVVITRLIEGDYPQYQKIIPTSCNQNITADRKDLIESMKAASLFARKSSNIVKWKITQDGIEITANATQVGNQKSLVLGKRSLEEDMTVAFNAKYILDVLGHIDANEVKIGLNGPLQPVLFSDAQNEFIHVIMPVRTQD